MRLWSLGLLKGEGFFKRAPHKGVLVVPCIKVHSGFFPQFLFRFETSIVHFMSRESDISQETIDDLASKRINYGKESNGKDHF